jgi:hypothetical protein
VAASIARDLHRSRRDREISVSATEANSRDVAHSTVDDAIRGPRAAEPVTPEPAPTTPHQHLELDIENGSEPIAGYLQDASGRRRFTGWVDLAGAIAAAHQPTTPGMTDPPSDTGITK